MEVTVAVATYGGDGWRHLAEERALASAARLDLPTVGEAGVPGYQSVAWYGLVGPKNMPADLLRKVSEETIRAVAAPAVRSVIAIQGGVAVGGTPAEFADFIVAERKRYETIVREAGMSVE